MAKSAVLETIDVTKDFTVWRGFFGFLRPFKRRAVDGLSMELHRGEILGIYGPNAAGKTTLLKMMAGLLRPTSGRIVLQQQDVTRRYDQAVQEVSIAIAESRSFYWRLTCRQNLEFFASLWGFGGKSRRRKVERVADVMGLVPYLDEKFMTLSSGLMQRMALARSLLANSTVWLFDEPTRDLDREYTGIAFEEMRRLRREGRAVALVTHEVDDLELMCDRVIVLEEGRLAAEGPPKEVLVNLEL